MFWYAFSVFNEASTSGNRLVFYSYTNCFHQRSFFLLTKRRFFWIFVTSLFGPNFSSSLAARFCVQKPMTRIPQLVSRQSHLYVYVAKTSTDLSMMTNVPTSGDKQASVVGAFLDSRTEQNEQLKLICFKTTTLVFTIFLHIVCHVPIKQGIPNGTKNSVRCLSHCE